MIQKEIAKEVLAVSLHVADASQFDIEETKKRMQSLTQSVLQSSLLKKDPKSNIPQTIDLEFQQIDNLKDLLPHLANCSNLKELILHGNRLNSLPDDLSLLTTVETLDISNNLFQNLSPVVQALKTMPKLYHLHIGIDSHEDEQLLIDSLPNLLTLNSKRIRFHDVLDSDRPSDRLTERSQQGSEVNFNQDDVDNMEAIFQSICTLQNASTENKDSALIQHVKEVMMDFQQKVSQTQTPHFLNTHILKAKFDLYELCFKELIEYFRQNDNRLEVILSGLQSEHKSIFNDLANVVYNLKDYKKIKKNNDQIDDLTLNNQQLLNQITQIQEKLSETQQQTDEMKIQMVQLEQENQQHKQVIKEQQNTIGNQSTNLEQINLKLQKLQNEHTMIQQSYTQLDEQKQQLEKQSSQFEFQIAQMQQSARSEQNQSESIIKPIQIVTSTQTKIMNFTEQEIQTDILAQLDQTIESGQFVEEPQIIEKIIKEEIQSEEIQLIKQEMEELQCQNQQLSQENKKYIDIIIRHSKNDKQSQFMNDKQSLQNTEQSQKYQSESTITQDKKIQKTINEMRTLVQPQSFRPLTMRQLKDLILEIYESKSRHDQRQLEFKLPLETMEQHLYTFLNYKYGLKNLALEWAACIINGIKKYGGEDNDIAVFGKILKNECEEDYKLITNQCKQTLQDLLKMNLRTKFPYKHMSDIKEMVNMKVQGFLFEEECQEILKYMYEDDVRDMIMSALKMNGLKVSPKNKAQTREEKLQQMVKKEKPKYEYNQFSKAVLDYQLRQHEDYLNSFIIAFKQFDTDRDGIIGEEDFRQLLSSINPPLQNEEIQRLLTLIDPFSTDKLNFSVIVHVLSNEKLEKGCLLQQISIV